jgi:hypothetical protein
MVSGVASKELVMNGIPDNQTSRTIFDGFFRTTKSRHLHSVPLRLTSIAHSHKKLVFASAAGLLTFSLPVVIAASNTADTNNGNSSSQGASSSENKTNRDPQEEAYSTSSNDVEFSQQSSSDVSGTSHNSSLTVNGHPIPVPENGSTHHTITNGQQTTTIDIDSHNQQHTNGDSASNNSSSSVNIQSNSGNGGNMP